MNIGTKMGVRVSDELLVGNNVAVRLAGAGSPWGSLVADSSDSTLLSGQDSVVAVHDGSSYLYFGKASGAWSLLWVDRDGALLRNDAAGATAVTVARGGPSPFSYQQYGYATDRLPGVRAHNDTFSHAANCIIELTVTALPSASYHYVEFRRLNSTNYLSVAWSPSSSGYMELDRWLSGSGTPIDTATSAISDGQRITIIANGTSVKAYANGSLRLDGSISELATENEGRLVYVGTGGVTEDIIAWPLSPSADVMRLLDSAITPGLATFRLYEPASYQTIQRNGSDQADIPIAAILPVAAEVEVEARWNGGDWTSLGTATGGWIDTVLADQAAGQGTFEIRCNGQTLSSAYVGIGDVIVVAGQSNAEGYGYNNQSYSHATLRATQVRDGVWVNGNDPFGEVAGPRGSAWPSAATAIMASTGYPVAFIDRAINGVSITTYLPTADHFDTATNYGNLADAIQRYGATLVVWWQGETDAFYTMAEATYNGHLDTIANAINADTGLKLMACLWQHITTTADANQDAIRTAISTAWADNANVLEGPDLSDMEQDDGWHLKTDVKLTEAGQRWAVKILPQL